MPLANYERVIYEKNPLAEVICQLRFPCILIINEKQPTEFQERIRAEYPLYQTTTEQQQQIIVGATKGALQTSHILQSEAINNYRFSSIDEKWHINLTSTFLALSTSSYNKWENFIEHFKEPLSALLEIYHPSFYERIGLRYVNVFKRSTLNLVDVDWSELIQPFVLGFMSNLEIKNRVRHQNMFVELDIGNGAWIQINTSKNSVGDVCFGFPSVIDEESFVIDADIFMMRKNIEELSSSLNYLHDYSTKLIRSIITTKLHNAMEPNKL